MTLCLALFLLAPGDLPTSLSDPDPAPEPVGAPLGDHILLRVRGGIWSSRALDFDTTLSNGTQLRSKATALYTAGIDAGGSIFHDRFVVFGSIEENFSSGIRSETASVCFGWRDWAGPTASAGVPNEVILFTGPMFGRFDISTSGFGGFDNGIGVRAGITLTWKLSPYAGFSLDAEYRFIEFDYKDKGSIVSGDKSIGGSGFWIGAGIDFRF